MGVVQNIGWILIGLLFFIHPVWPRSAGWQNHDERKKGIRIGSVLIIVVFGFWMRYGV